MRMLQKKYIGIVLLLLVAVSASAQKAERDYIRKGNRFFKDSVYVDAEVNYRKALEVNPKSTVSMFNLGNTLTQQNLQFHIYSVFLKMRNNLCMLIFNFLGDIIKKFPCYS